MAEGVTAEAVKAVGTAVSAIGTQPLSLALVIMNLVLLGYLFYIGAATNSDRKTTVDMIIGWQKETDKLLANCVSGEVTRTMLDNMQKITETMLQAEQKEIDRMQEAINAERSKSWELREREKRELDELKKRRGQEEPSLPKAQNMSGEVFLPLPTLPDIPVLGTIK